MCTLSCFSALELIIFQKIADQKLQAFSIGAMGMRTLSRKELKEQKKKEEEEAAAHVSTPKLYFKITKVSLSV